MHFDRAKKGLSDAHNRFEIEALTRSFPRATWGSVGKFEIRKSCISLSITDPFSLASENELQIRVQDQKLRQTVRITQLTSKLQMSNGQMSNDKYRNYKCRTGKMTKGRKVEKMNAERQISKDQNVDTKISKKIKCDIVICFELAWKDSDLRVVTRDVTATLVHHNCTFPIRFIGNSS